ncbi:MAG TPA: hypothetical protein VFP37_01520 [Steroidobacteraceae bacterium]|nr:hypothetical protein [Steroidobacteraceae bacterium]
MQRHLGWIVLAGALGATVWGACETPTATGGILLTGQWGSDRGRLTATQVSTTFTGACGSGSTTEPIMLDKKGRFDMQGLYGATGAAQSSARFRGTVGSKTLTLRVMRADSTEAMAPIVLNLGQQPALATCH